MRQWVRRTAALHDELAEIAEVRDPRWWLVAGGAALPWQPRGTYVYSDADPSGDTFMAYPSERPADPIARAHAARTALRELDGTLPQQPLAVTIERSANGAVAVPSKLDIAAFAIGDRIITHRLADRVEQEDGTFRPGDGVPFVTVTVGEEAVETARHGHRRAWTSNGVAQGPWLGLGSAGGLAIVSTCHMIVDGFGHARIAARIAELTARSSAQTVRVPDPPSVVADAVPLRVGWRELGTRAPRATQLAYALGILLHRLAGKPDAAFSPTFQIPVAPGDPADPERMRRRVIPAVTSVRFEAGRPEPFESFAARTRQILAREAKGSGLIARLLVAARAVPAPLAWKRRAVGAERPSWLEPVANVVGGRGCLSKLRLDVDAPPLVAVSSPARLAQASDDLGGCVVTIIESGERATITWCGSGRAGDPALLDDLLALV